MKDYSLKINGQNYTVQIDEVNDASTVAHVVVNGTAYEVEMKMENNIDADRAGVVKEVCIQQGATVMEGDNLIVIE